MRRNFRPDAKAALLALAACGLFFASCLTRTEKSPGTPAGWRATVGTVAGDGSPGLQDGAARAARFSDPFGVAVGRDGTAYVTDAGENNRIRRLTPQGEVTTLAGGGEGFADGAGAAASFNTPSALAPDAAGNLYVADTGNNRIRKVTPEGFVTTVAGDGAAGFRDGAGTQAQFDAPVGVAVDKDGNLYVADTYNDRVRLVTKDGQVRTLAGAGRPGLADGDAGQSLFDTPCAVAVSEAGEVYVADTGNNRLRKVTKDGQVSTINVYDPTATVEPAPRNTASEAGPPASASQSQGATPTGGANTQANAPQTPAFAPFPLSKPAGLALTRDGFLYVTELDRGRVVQVAPDGAA
ncbi:MAG TPA: hypothetical protein VNZ44_11620, partial [Pyrinomonadaceae bacterium]|nr:hypothetical protein [Pyrinomonadaceae bacterium]